jgi:hypothetical protein
MVQTSSDTSLRVPTLSDIEVSNVMIIYNLSYTQFEKHLKETKCIWQPNKSKIGHYYVSDTNTAKA